MVDHTGTNVKVTTRNGQTFTARKLICTIPLNVLHTIQFNPALSRDKMKASKLGQVNKTIKVHVEVPDPDMRTWSGISYPHNKLICGWGDHERSAGGTHIVFFGGDCNLFHPEENVDETLKAVKSFGHKDIQKMVFTNWAKDEFADGGWLWYRPGMERKYIDSLRKREGNVLFANSDWANGGWRGFVDGAIAAGAAAAHEVVTELRQAGQKEFAKL